METCPNPSTMSAQTRSPTEERKMRFSGLDGDRPFVNPPRTTAESVSTRWRSPWSATHDASRREKRADGSGLLEINMLEGIRPVHEHRLPRPRGRKRIRPLLYWGIAVVVVVRVGRVILRKLLDDLLTRREQVSPAPALSAMRPEPLPAPRRDVGRDGGGLVFGRIGRPDAIRHLVPHLVRGKRRKRERQLKLDTSLLREAEDLAALAMSTFGWRSSRPSPPPR